MLNRYRKILLVFLFLILVIGPCKAFSGFSPDQGVYVIEEISGKEIFSQNKDQRFEPASTTKLMTALVMLDHVKDLNEQVICGPEVLDYDWRDSEAGLWENQKTNYLELLYSMLLPSGNDAAGVIAVNVGKKLLNNPSAEYHEAQKAFVNAMNEKAGELGLVNTHFTNPAGTADPNHYTTPSDYAKVVDQAFQNELIVDVSRTLRYPITSIKGFTYDLINTDVMLFPTIRDLGIQPDPNLTPEQQAQVAAQPNPLFSSMLKAGKTGTNEKDQRTFVFRSDIGDGRVIGILFDLPSEIIFNQAKAIIDEVNSNYSLQSYDKDIIDLNIPLANTFLLSGNTLKLEDIEPVYNFENKNETDKLEYSIRWNNNYINTDNDSPKLINDINQGDKVGSLLVSSNGQTLKTIPLYSKNSLQVGRLNNLIFISVGLIVVVLISQFIFLKIKKKSKTAKRKAIASKRISF